MATDRKIKKDKELENQIRGNVSMMKRAMHLRQHEYLECCRLGIIGFAVYETTCSLENLRHELTKALDLRMT
jgi:hypothetical protein